MRIYYGWFVLAASAVAELLAQGATSYGAGLFVLPLQAEFGLSRANASSSVLVLFLGAIVIALGHHNSGLFGSGRAAGGPGA